jgi:uncharacterized protein (TIGR00251 family)
MPAPQSIRVVVRLTPRGGRDAIDGWTRGADGRAHLRVRVAAPPVDGGANAALVELIAKALGVPKRAVHLVSGEHARLKTLEIAGVDAAVVHRIFGQAS